MENNINLDQIWDNIQKDFDNGGKTIRELGKNAMLQFGKQLLELAAKNATIKINHNYPHEITKYDVAADKQSILNTINQIE